MKSVVYMGTPDFAVPALKFLLENDNYDVKLVVSQTDKPQGRHQELVAPPVKQLALQYDVEVYQPKTLKSDEAFDKISFLQPDFIVVAAYGKILPQRILDIPVYGCINLHGSVLPKYRGAAPIQWCVINGEKETGITSMYMNAGLDTGDILLVSKTAIGENETAGELFDRLASLCPVVLNDTLSGLIDGSISASKQDDSQATYVSVLNKDMAVINWEKSAVEIHNKVRGMNPWPIAKTLFNGKILKIYSTLKSEKQSTLPVGSLFSEKDRLFVVCGEKSVIEITELQLEGAKRLSSADFLRGHKINNLIVLGK